MTIRQYKAKGHFIDTILQVVALDDAVALIAFSVCAAIVQATANWQDADLLARLSENLGEAMVGINEDEIQTIMAARGE